MIGDDAGPGIAGGVGDADGVAVGLSLDQREGRSREPAPGIWTGR
jgi:hypothetical protein